MEDSLPAVEDEVIIEAAVVTTVDMDRDAEVEEDVVVVREGEETEISNSQV